MEQYFNVAKIGNNICLRGYDQGKYVNTKIPYKPYMFTETLQETEYRSIDGKYLKRKDFTSMSDLWQYQKQAKNLQIDLYGMDNSVCAFMNDNLSTDFDPAKIRIFYLDIENYMKDENNKLFGIDPYGAPGAMTAITVFDTLTETYHVFGDTNWQNKMYREYKVEYHHADDEFQLLVLFMQFWTRNYPHIVTGWNVDGYDIPYLYNRIERVLGETAAKKLSPWNKITTREYTNEYGQEAIDYTFVGISITDYRVLYKKNTFHKQESYSLDYIAFVELGKGKVDYHELGYKDLDDLYDRNPQLYIDYNIRDIESLVQIDAKNKFMNIITGVAYYALVNFDEVNSPIRCWDSLKHQYLLKNNIITSPKSNKKKEGKFIGAYVKQPIPALYRWVMVFDLASLYPSIIMTCNVGNETIVPEYEVPDGLMELYNRNLSQVILDGGITPEHQKLLVDNKMSMAANGMFYYNETNSIQSVLSDNILKERKIYKGRMLDASREYEAKKSDITDPAEHKRYNDIIQSNNNRQMVTKVLANAMFGGMGNQHDRYFDTSLAESVTLTGQTVIKWAELKVNEYFNKVMCTEDVSYCIYSDTDSIFVNLETFVAAMKLDDKSEQEVTDFLVAVGDVVNKKLVEFYDELGTILNSTNNRLLMKREAISPTTIFRKKKNYAMKVLDNEGVRFSPDDPYYKIMGIEVVKASTPKILREKLKQALTMMLNDCTKFELYDFFESVKAEYIKYDLIEDIAFPKGTTDIDKYVRSAKGGKLYGAKCPIHVRGSIVFNHHYAGTEEEKIVSGEDVRYTYLKLPNPTGENVISIKEGFPDELKHYIDYNTNFDKLFKKPIESLSNIIGFQMNDTPSLLDF